MQEQPSSQEQEAPTTQPTPSQEGTDGGDAPSDPAAIAQEPSSPPEQGAPASQTLDSQAAKTPEQGGEPGHQSASAEADQANSTTEGASTETALAKAQERISELESALLRVQADMQNAKRRNERSISEAHRYAIERFSLEVLLLRDHMEMGAQSITKPQAGGEEAIETIRKGFEMVLEGFPAMLKRFDINEIECKGKPFDPNLHEAVGQEESEDVASNHIICIRQKGYTISDRLLRPALVVVAK